MYSGCHYYYHACCSSGGWKYVMKSYERGQGVQDVANTGKTGLSSPDLNHRWLSLLT